MTALSIHYVAITSTLTISVAHEIGILAAGCGSTYNIAMEWGPMGGMGYDLTKEGDEYSERRDHTNFMITL
jgi:hypothetical protein